MLHGQESESPACTWAFDASYCEGLRAKSAIPSPVCPHSSNPLGAQLSFQWPAKLEVTSNTLLSFGSVCRAQAKNKEVMEPFLPPWSTGLTYNTKSCPLLLKRGHPAQAPY